MSPNPVSWFEIYVQDMPRAQAFYEAVFSTKLQRLNTEELEMMAFPIELTSPGAGGALARMEGMPSGGNSTLVYFACADCAVEAGRVEGAGGKVFKPKFSVGEYGFISLAFDTEGNMFGMHSRG